MLAQYTVGSKAFLWTLAITLSILPLFALGSAGGFLEEGERYFARGHYHDAVNAWTEAIHAAAKDSPEHVLALGKRAEAYQALGFHRKSIQDLSTAIQLAEQTNELAIAARLHGSLANGLYFSGQPHAAQRELDKCLKYADEHDDRELLALALNSVGNFLADPTINDAAVLGVASGGTSNFSSIQALSYRDLSPESAYDSSYSLALSTGQPLLTASVVFNRARLALAKGELENALALLVEAESLLQGLPESAQKAMGLVTVGLLELQAAGQAGFEDGAHTERVFDTLQSAAATARGVNDPGSESYALGYLARLYDQQGRHDEALQLTRQALSHAMRASAPEILYLWQWQLGRLQRTLGDLDRAVANYREAVATLRSIRGALVTGYGGPSFQQIVGPVFLELADILLERSDQRGSEDEIQLALLEARATMELLKTAELEDYFQDDCVAALQAKLKTIDELSPATAAIYPIIFADRIELLVSLPQGMWRTSVPVDRETVVAEVRKFRRLLEKRTTRQYLRPARKLYDWLIRPVEHELSEQGIETLVIIPGGSLRTIPLSALNDGERHLIEKFAVAVTPGLTLLDPRPLRQADITLLVAGITESVQGFPALPFVEKELGDIQDIFGGRRFQDVEFASVNVEQELDSQPYSIVHLASHAQFSTDARSSFLLTYDGRLSMDDLERLIKLSQFRDEPVELLTLSACATAAGDDRAALGLAGIAVKAGARSALASLWFINDQATSALVTQFYRNLVGAGVSKAKALQQAQLSMLDDPAYAHPFYWAPFLLIGNWL